MTSAEELRSIARSSTRTLYPRVLGNRLYGRLRAIDRPTLIIPGDDDQLVPIKATAYRAAKIVRDATLNVYPGGGHGLAQLQAEQFNANVLDFLRGA